MYIFLLCFQGDILGAGLDEAGHGELCCQQHQAPSGAAVC